MPTARRRAFLKATGSVVVLGGLTGYTQQTSPVDGVANDSQQNGTETASGDTEPPVETGVIGVFRVVHAAPDAPDMDVYFDRERAVADMNFGDVSPYFEVVPEQYFMQLTEEDDPWKQLFGTEVTVTPGQRTTAVSYGEQTIGTETTLTVDLLDDDLSDPGGNRARVRLFHASPDAPPIDVRLIEAPDSVTQKQGETSVSIPLFEELRYGEAATTEIPAGTYTLGVFPAGQQQSGGTAADGEPITDVELATQSGGSYSAFAVGYLDPTAVAADEEFELITVADATGDRRSRGATE